MTASTPPEPPANFEAALDGLQQIVADLEEGQLGREESLARFEQGIGLLRNCYRILEQAEQKIELLVRMAPDGSEVSTPFDAAATFEPETSPKKSSRRKSSKPTATPREESSSATATRSAESGTTDSPENSGPSLF